jgi:hypothetical protein
MMGAILAPGPGGKASAIAAGKRFLIAFGALALRNFLP